MIIKKNGKYYITNELLGEMMVYGVGSENPYIKRFSMKFYLSDEEKAELKALA